MSTPDSTPFVSVLTPAYNAEKYLVQCIESVLAQTHRNFEYTIVDNRSTDRTLEIARSFAAKDARLKVVTNDRFVNVIENHNIAFRLISPLSKYCKVVSADDWLMPDCIRRMVSVAEAHPTVGIVGSYQRRNEEVRWTGLLSTVDCVPGRDVCRMALLDNAVILGNPTSSLFRSELVRQHPEFLPHARPHADTSACFTYLQHCDFGFVHDVLSVERVHERQVTAGVRDLNLGDLASIEYVLGFGPVYLTTAEFETVRARAFSDYYRVLGGCVMKLKGIEFWRHHAAGMRQLGSPISWTRVVRGALDEAIEEMRHPKTAINKLRDVFRGRSLASVRAGAIRR